MKISAVQQTALDDFASGLSYQAIAAKNNWPIGTVKSRLSRARKKAELIMEQINETESTN